MAVWLLLSVGLGEVLRDRAAAKTTPPSSPAARAESGPSIQDGHEELIRQMMVLGVARPRAEELLQDTNWDFQTAAQYAFVEPASASQTTPATPTTAATMRGSQRTQTTRAARTTRTTATMRGSHRTQTASRGVHARDLTMARRLEQERARGQVALEWPAREWYGAIRPEGRYVPHETISYLFTMAALQNEGQATPADFGYDWVRIADGAYARNPDLFAEGAGRPLPGGNLGERLQNTWDAFRGHLADYAGQNSEAAQLAAQPNRAMNSPVETYSMPDEEGELVSVVPCDAGWDGRHVWTAYQNRVMGGGLEGGFVVEGAGYGGAIHTIIVTYTQHVHAELVARFCEATEADPATAEHYLSARAANWNFETAIAQFNAAAAAVDQFCEATEADRATAQRYLSAARGNVETAIARFNAAAAVVARFCEATEADRATADHYLSAARGNVETAIARFNADARREEQQRREEEQWREAQVDQFSVMMAMDRATATQHLSAANWHAEAAMEAALAAWN